MEHDFRPDGSHDNEHFNQIMDEAINQYKTRLLPANMDEPFVKLLEGIQRNVDEGNLLASKNKPVELTNPVVYVVRTQALEGS